MTKIELNKQEITDNNNERTSNFYNVEDVFSFNKKPTKQSWWKKLIYGKVNISGCQHNPLVFKFLIFMPLMIYLFLNVPHSNILGYFLSLFFSVKAGVALDQYIKNQNYVKRMIERDYLLTVVDWKMMAIITLFTSLLF